MALLHPSHELGFGRAALFIQDVGSHDEGRFLPNTLVECFTVGFVGHREHIV